MRMPKSLTASTFFEVQVNGQARQGRGVVLLAQLCAIAETAAGELALVSWIVKFSTCFGITSNLAIPPTPQEQQQVELAEGKVQFPCSTRAATAPTGIADPAGPETAMESAIGSSE